MPQTQQQMPQTQQQLPQSQPMSQQNYQQSQNYQQGFATPSTTPYAYSNTPNPYTQQASRPAYQVRKFLRNFMMCWYVSFVYFPYRRVSIYVDEGCCFSWERALVVKKQCQDGTSRFLCCNRGSVETWHSLFPNSNKFHIYI